jgi:hypothetical protein
MTFRETPQYKRLLNPQTLDYKFDNQTFVGFETPQYKFKKSFLMRFKNR